MQPSENLPARVRAAIEHEAHLDFASNPIDVALDGNALTLSGDVPNIATKQRAFAAACEVAGDTKVVDRLRLASTPELGDGAIRDVACEWLLRDVDFLNCTVRILDSGRWEVMRECQGDSCGEIDVSVADGVISLDGHVISLSHRRLAGVLAWWARGCRAVVNNLEIRPPEDDNDEEVIEALRLVLETDPLIHVPEQITIECRNYCVTLRGIVGSEEERRQAERDAWCLDGVQRVVSALEVRP